MYGGMNSFEVPKWNLKGGGANGLFMLFVESRSYCTF